MQFLTLRLQLPSLFFHPSPLSAAGAAPPGWFYPEGPDEGGSVQTEAAQSAPGEFLLLSLFLIMSFQGKRNMQLNQISTKYVSHKVLKSSW